MEVDSIVVGAGVVGLAVGRALAKTGREVLVLERHSTIGSETSSRNSEVIHAGIYYEKGSLKAKLCLRGKKLLYEFCKEFGVEHKRIGKLIVACSNDQIPALDGILRKGKANGVDDLVFVDEKELGEIEPALKAKRGILSPSTGIIDSHEFMLALQGDMEAAGGTLVLRCPVKGIQHTATGYAVSIDDEEKTKIGCREVVNSAGLAAQTVSASLVGLDPTTIPPLYLSRGCYFTLAGLSPFGHLIYPLPTNEGLGVHLTLDLRGRARFGPDTEWVEDLDYNVDPRRSASFYSAVRSYYPDLRDGQLEPAYAGIRPKIVGPNQPAGDFVLQDCSYHQLENYVALYGIESPGLTSSLAIAEHIVEHLH